MKFRKKIDYVSPLSTDICLQKDEILLPRLAVRAPGSSLASISTQDF